MTVARYIPEKLDQERGMLSPNLSRSPPGGNNIIPTGLSGSSSGTAEPDEEENSFEGHGNNSNVDNNSIDGGGDEEKSRMAAVKISNFSIAALINKDHNEELERRRRLLQTMPMLGRI